MIMEEDPGFVDAKAENFLLQRDSIIFKEITDFEQIPFGKIGLYKDEFRRDVSGASLKLS